MRSLADRSGIRERQAKKSPTSAGAFCLRDITLDDDSLATASDDIGDDLVGTLSSMTKSKIRESCVSASGTTGYIQTSAFFDHAAEEALFARLAGEATAGNTSSSDIEAG